MKLHKVSLIVFYDSRNRILLQDRRGISKVGEEWGYFGGHIERGETPEQALLRETKEELGFDLRRYNYKFLGRFTDPKNTNRDFTVDRWVYTAPMPPLSQLKLAEGRRMKLFTLGQAMRLKMVSEGDKEVITALEVYFKQNEEKIIIANRYKRKLSAVLHLPKKKTIKFVILTHTFKGNKDCQPIIRDCARRLASEGIAAIRFDCYGSGESEGNFEDSTVTSQARDLQDVISFARSKGFKDFAVIGFSLGGAGALLSYGSQIKTLIFWSFSFKLDILFERYKKEFENKKFIVSKKILSDETVKISRAMWREFGSLKLNKYMQKVRCPTLVMFGDKDHLAEPATVKKYFDEFNCPKKLVIIKSGDHNFLNRGAEEKALRITSDWIKKYL